MSSVIRPESHETDTAARRIVPGTLPLEWEHRELTGRDYGIDMVVEIFGSGTSTGNELYLQIKGTTRTLDTSGLAFPYDVPVRTLRYAEAFLVPVLLVVCAVRESAPKCYYVWLQEYIRAVLEHENPGWRQNRATARVYVPIGNTMPGNEGHLRHISNYPRRLHDWGHVGRILHELRSCCSQDEIHEWSEDQIRAAKSALGAALQLRGLFGDADWKWGWLIRTDVVESGIMAAELLLRGRPFAVEEVRSCCSGIPDGVNQEYLERQLRLVLVTTGDRLLAALAQANDYRLSHSLWTETGDHDF